MVPLSKGLPRNRKRTRRSQHRPVRHSPDHQTQVYISPCPDPNALALDALSVDWSTLPLAYGFPPMPILPKVLQKIRHSSADTILVSGPTQSLHGGSTRDSGCSRPPLPDGTTQDLDAPQPGNVQLPCLDVVRNSLNARGFSLLTETADRIAVPHQSLPVPSTMGSGQNSDVGVVERRQIQSRPLIL